MPSFSSRPPSVIRPAFFLLLFLGVFSSLPAQPRLGLQSYTCRNLSFEKMVAFAVEHRLQEVQVFGRHLDPGEPESALAEKQALLRRHGVRVYAGYYPLTADQDDNRRVFELARRFGMDFIVVEPKELALWDDIERLVREFDMRVAIHNHGAGTVYADPATVRKVLAGRDSRIGVCLDVGWVTAAGHNAAAVFRAYGDRVWDIHFKDKAEPSMVNGQMRVEEPPLGEGRVDFAGLARAIRERDWSGVLALESDNREVAKAPGGFVEHGRRFFNELFPSRP